MGSVVFGMFLALIAADVLFGALSEAITWLMWRSEVRFKRRYSYSDPMPYFEFRHWMWARRGRSAWAA